MLEFCNITVKGQDGPILEEFSFRVEDGVLLGLIGTNHRETSVLLELAGGVSIPQAGDIRLNGVSLLGKRNLLREQIGFMPREYGFYSLLTVTEYYNFFLSMYRIHSSYYAKKIEEVLDFVNLKSYKDTLIQSVPKEAYPFLCLGRVLLHEPSWVLLDHPFAQLSIKDRQEMARMVLMLQESGVSLVVNTPLYREMVDIFTKIAILEDGKIRSVGSVNDLYRSTRKEKPVRMHVISGMEQVISVLKYHPLVDCVVMDESTVMFHFNGGEREEAQVLTQLVASGALIQNYMRDSVNLEGLYQEE